MKGNKLYLVLTLIAGIVIGMLIQKMFFSSGETPVAQAKAEHAEEGDHHEDGENVARLGESELKEFGIELAVAGPGKLQIHTDLTGEIVIDPERLAHVVPRFPGVVKEVRKKIGDKVRKVEIIAIIESNESLAPYEVKSLINGTVIDMHMTLGELIDDDAHAVVVADLSHVWADFSVYQKDLPHVRIGQPVEITLGPGISAAKGKISYITPVVDEETRTATARVVLKNADGRWKPGLFVKGRLIVEEKEVKLLVPKSAIETLEDRPVVFVQTDEGFKPQTVVVGRTNGNGVEIIGGLRPGQRYVTKNAFTLKAELGKSAFGDEH